MALIGHPIVGDQRYSYAYAKQVAQHHRTPATASQAERNPCVGDDSRHAAAPEADGNSASIALSRCIPSFVQSAG